MDNTSSPRKPAFALAMSFLLPGYGQLYNGEVNKAIWTFLAFALLSVPGVALIALYLPMSWTIPALALGLALTLGIWLWGMVDAWRGAASLPHYTLKAWQLSGVYVLVFLLCDALALPLLIDYVRVNQVASFRIPSTSMEPSVMHGDILFADQRYNRPSASRSVRRGDIAIFTYPNNRTQNYIKRVIALPGDRVRLAGRQVWVNDQPLTRQERVTASGIEVTESIDGVQWQVKWGQTSAVSPASELVVPPGHAFVLGDNRGQSTDGRHFGPVPLSDIVGKVRQIWFSSSSDAGVRWGRIGLVLGR